MNKEFDMKLTMRFLKMYQKADKKGKGEILFQYCDLTDVSRDAALKRFSRRLMLSPVTKKVEAYKFRSDRQRIYGRVHAEILKECWQLAGLICAEKLYPILLGYNKMQPMDELSKEYIISFFDKNLMLHGDRPDAVRWSLMGQILHYQSMLDIGNINGKKILDFGCGKGDFYQFLKDKGIAVEYHGYDINKKLITVAKEKFPNIDFRFFDIDKDIFNEDFDYIFLCGVFNLKVQGLGKMIESALTKLFERCRIALAFNALSEHNPKKDFELHYILPEDMFAFAVKNLSPHVSLRHDRIIYDFTMFVYKDANEFSL